MGVGAGIGGLLSAGSQIFGATQQAGAASDAQKLQMQMFQTLQQNLEPYNKAGQGALPQIQALLGLGPQGAGGIGQTLSQLPGYQFSLDQGLKSVQNSAAARGLGGSGAALKGAANYATGLAQGNYGQYLSQLMGLAGMGESAGAGVGQGALTAGQSIGNFGIQGANALAGGAVGGANALGQGYLNSQFLSSPLLQNLLNGQGSSGMYGNIGGNGVIGSSYQGG